MADSLPTTTFGDGPPGMGFVDLFNNGGLAADHGGKRVMRRRVREIGESARSEQNAGLPPITISSSPSST